MKLSMQRQLRLGTFGAHVMVGRRFGLDAKDSMMLKVGDGSERHMGEELQLWRCV
jgi:hypothetical protein